MEPARASGLLRREPCPTNFFSKKILDGQIYRDVSAGGKIQRHRSRPLDEIAKKCSWTGCERPNESSRFHQIYEGMTSGGQEWESLAGSVLCHACHQRFRTTGTLEKSSKYRQSAKEKPAAKGHAKEKQVKT
jgi:hypothetical protein